MACGVCAIIPGPRTFTFLIKRYGSAGAALDALPELAGRGGANRAIKICPRADAEREIAATLRHGARFIALGEPDYPQRLAAIDDPPPLLIVRGSPDALLGPLIAIVGSRNASAAAVKFTERLARDLGQAGFGIVSGLARGIDAAAHRASLATGTIAVLAGGLARPYPPEHASLLENIVAASAAISEMPIDSEPRARDFPRRNRLISGLALGVVVVEAARRSGSLITARLALEQGRDVFAVPGSPLDPRAEGTNGLLKQGAGLVTEAADVIDVVMPAVPRVAAPTPDDQGAAPPATQSDNARDQIVSLLGPTPVSIDDLVRLSGAPPSTIRTILLELELAGRLNWQAGGLIALQPA